MMSEASQVGDGQHGLEAAQHAVGAPILGQLDGRADQMALVLLQLRLEPLEQREGVGGGAGKSGNDLVVVELAHLARRALDDDVAQRHLAVAAYRHLPAALGVLAPHADDGRAVKLFHDE